jgi:KAP-like P-loop domain-containing protein
MWSDNVTSEDLLGFEYLSKAAGRLILDPSLHPTTIGVFGLWGSGKSCLAGMLCESLSDRKDVLCIQFNAWTFEGFDDAKSALMDTILERLLEEEKLPAKSRKLFEKLRRAVNVGSLAKLGAKVGIPAAVAAVGAHDPSLALPAAQAAAAAAASNITVDDAADVLKPKESEEPSRKDLREFRSDFEKLLKDAKLSTLVVFIDDLDRCLPNTVIEVLEAIRLFLSTPKTVFVVCADERLVRSAVRRRFPPQPGDDFDVANEYLEKLVQHPIRITPLGPEEVRLYLALLLVQSDLGAKFSPALKGLLPRKVLEGLSTRDLVEKLMSAGAEREEIIALVGQIAGVLGEHLNGNPRQLKRFMNTLMLRMGMAEDRELDLDRRVLAKMMVLEYVKLRFFRQLFEWQAAQAGKPAELATMENVVGGGKGGAKKAKAGNGASEAAPTEPDSNVILWTSDPWLRGWLKSEPLLAGKDLRPYFQLSREHLTGLGSTTESLTPAASGVLDLLLAPAKLVRARGPKQAASLSIEEATSVLRVLAEQCRRSQSLAGEGSPLEAAVELVRARTELAAEAMFLFEELSVKTLSLGAPPLLKKLAEDVPAMAAGIDRLLAKWESQQANTKLAETAKLTRARRKS